MSEPSLLVDGRVLDEQHPGVAHFWIPVLAAWASRGGRGLVAHRPEQGPDPRLLAAGFAPVLFDAHPRDPLALARARRFVRATGAAVTLSPLYLTLDGAPRNLGTVFDLTGRSHPRSRMARATWEFTMRWTLWRAATIVCATAAAARDVEQAFPGARGRTAIVPAIAPDPPRRDPAVPQRFGLAPPYVLTVASHLPHKRLAELARAWSASATSIPLALAGRGTERLTAPPRVRGLGYVRDDELDALLAAAACLVSASVAEGFGLPIVAAMSAGVPVAATRVPALEEVAGDAASWMAPDAIEALVRTALSLASEPATASDRVARGRDRAQAFTAARAAAALQMLM